MIWQKIGDYEYEIDQNGNYTGRYRTATWK
jgi:hypothetical protein